METISKSVAQETFHFKFSSVATVGMSTIGGQFMAGPLGAVTGFLSSLVDEISIQNGYTEKHYLTTAAFWGTTTVWPIMQFAAAVLPPSLQAVGATAIATSGLALPYMMDDFLNFEKKFDFPLEAFHMINRLFDRNQILSTDELQKIYVLFKTNPTDALEHARTDFLQLYDNPFLSVMLKSISVSVLRSISSNFFLYILATYSRNLFIVNLLLQYPTLSLDDLTTLSPYLKEAFKILLIFMARDGVDFALENVENHLSFDQYRIVLNKSTEILLQDGNGRKVLGTEGGRELIKNLTPDLSKLIYRGASRLSYSLRSYADTLTVLRFIRGYNVLSAYAPLAAIYQQATAGITQRITETFTEFAHKEMEFWDLKFNIASNIDTINLRDGDRFSQHQYSSLLIAQSQREQHVAYLEKLRSAIKKGSDLLSQVIDVCYYGALIAQAQIEIAEIPAMHSAVEKIYNFIHSPQELEANSKELNVAKQRLTEFFNILDAPSTSTVQRKYNDQGQIIIENYSLKLSNNPLVKIDHLIIEPCKRYAITGPSGCGKTSFLMDLKQGIYGNFSSSGTISTPIPSVAAQPSIMFIDQNLYLPPHTTLFEAICFPRILSQFSEQEVSALRARVISLMQELQFNVHTDDGEVFENGIISRLDDKEFTLSGGQFKKIALIQAILQDPQVLVADEVLTGLDPQSLRLAENAIAKYIHGTILMVDHHAHDNNHLMSDGKTFYQGNIHFENGTVIQKSLDIFENVH